MYSVIGTFRKMSYFTVYFFFLSNMKGTGWVRKISSGNKIFLSSWKEQKANPFLFALQIPSSSPPFLFTASLIPNYYQQLI